MSLIQDLYVRLEELGADSEIERAMLVDRLIVLQRVEAQRLKAIMEDNHLYES